MAKRPLLNQGYRNEVSRRLRSFRAKHLMRQEDLAKAIGVTRQTILAIEKGKYVPSLDLAFRISRYFKVNIEEVFSYEDEVRTVGVD